ncbi:electron transfer flavoprotein beta subunit [Desulfacinum infernum DSM 9756]|uniref:Electron transfer flavoprotein subunit beta n=1 Tax=Desulfacinum infernum DSM 9756 TaxID=1121391 RepID=A0A1M5DGU5_9BACT|nr:electron transfer flavoprotein subunit beta/FixA family protein [Desulfacinum infernum]MBC7357796.1 electron transfer flavoprotein subunit beta [Desulfacinum sp.]MBZ4659491.1 electron transfer flavoprotein subunit beta/FixA family protein [Desulfacinum sp.]SHF66180.1 electron transfer flavoprotein beta subunit [Desulfacinum infernum DSM 9756]
MNIVVLLKQTPDTESVIRIANDGQSIVTDDLKWIINPYDEFAVEAALRLKEKHGGTVTIVSCGPQRVVESIRTAMAMGADKGVLIDDPALEGADSLGVARALAAAVKELEPEIVLCGSRAVDYDQAQRGPMVAELLEWPHLGLAISLECDGSTVTIERPIEGGKVTLEADLPALVTMGGSHAVWNPRYASLPGIMKAKKKPLEVKTLADLGLDPAECGAEAAKIRIVSLEMPPERQAGRIIDDGLDTEGKAAELVRALHEEAKVI